MPTTPIKLVVDCSTGISTEIPLSAEEIEQAKADAITFATLEAEREAQAQAKAEAKSSALAKLEALGLTEEEAAALIS